MKTASASALALLALFTFSGCASQGSLDNLRNDIDAVKTRLFAVERDQGATRDEAKQAVAQLEQSFRGDLAAVRKLAADLQAGMDSTRSEVQALGGKLDDTTTAAKKPAEDLARYREDSDKRVIALEERLLKTQKELDGLGKQLQELGAALKKREETPAGPDALYLKGLDTFKAGDMPAARELFTKFIEQNPQHELVANAQYWIGETHYSEKSYEPAILAFQEVIKNFPTKEKVSAAMLKQAMAFRDIKDAKSAKYVLKKLVEGFPKSEEAKKAKELLKEIK